MAQPALHTSGMIGVPLNPKTNSLNLIRLLLALTVLFAHSWYIVGPAPGPIVAGNNLGGWAVAGFFGVSGYLITGSRFNNKMSDYLVHRVARIMPAFVVCLIVMVAFFAPIGYFVYHGTLSGYLVEPTRPFLFLYGNLFLNVNYYDIAGTPAGVLYPGVWNGSLWTLYYEFLCYLIIAAIVIVSWVRKHPWLLAVAFAISVAVYAKLPLFNLLVQGDASFGLLAQLLPFFLGGSVVYAFRKKVGMHWAVGLGSIVGTGLLIVLIPGWGGQLASPLIAYSLLWISSWLPAPRVILTHDISYGAYIYAFPVQQLLAVWGLGVVGVWWFTLLATLATIPFAVASWLWVERPVMQRVRRGQVPTTTAGFRNELPPRDAAPANAAANTSAGVAQTTVASAPTADATALSEPRGA